MTDRAQCRRAALSLAVAGEGRAAPAETKEILEMLGLLPEQVEAAIAEGGHLADPGHWAERVGPRPGARRNGDRTPRRATNYGSPQGRPTLD